MGITDPKDILKSGELIGELRLGKYKTIDSKFYLSAHNVLSYFIANLSMHILYKVLGEAGLKKAREQMREQLVTFGKQVRHKRQNGRPVPKSSRTKRKDR